MVARGSFVVVLAACMAFPAHATSTEGRILVGHPGTGFGSGVTELMAPCDVDHALNGFDGMWFPVSSETFVELTPTDNAFFSDLDLYFYGKDCILRDGWLTDGGIGGPESGTIPDGTGYVLVTAAIGVDAGFRLALT